MAGKPIQVIHRIINGDVKETGSNDIVIEKSGEKLDQNFEDSFLDGIQDAIKKLNVNKNCSDNLFNWIYDSPIGTAISYGTSINLGKGMSLLGMKALSKVSFSENMCVFVDKWSKNLDFFISMAVKQAMLLFSRIDAFKNRLEKLLLNFNNNIRDCLISTLINVRNLLNNPLTDVKDYNSLADLMLKCPCIEDILSKLFKMDCSKALRNPAAIIACLIAAGITAGQALCFINNFINEIINDIADVFNQFQNVIKVVMDSLLLPFRYLVKKFCQILTAKIDMTWLLKTAKKMSFDCLFIYTLEKKKNGKTYPGMSILDMINTEKLWVNCLESVCPDFSEDTKRKIKKYNEDLRLNFKYWNDPNVTDIFLAGIFLKNPNNQFRQSMVRELYSRQKSKNIKVVFTELLDTLKDLGNMSVTTTAKDCGLDEENPYANNLTPTADAIKNSDGLEEENPFGANGTKLFKKDVEPLIISMLLNIGNAINQDTYEEKFSELTKWEQPYKKSQKHINAINDINQRFKNGVNSGEDRDTRVSDPADVPVILPNYVIVNDYTEANFSNKPKRTPGEQLLPYYVRWFANKY